MQLKGAINMGHIVLLGDSIFDNESYVNRDEDVTAHLRKIIQKDFKVTLCAVDGAMIDGISRQVERIPEDASDLFLSIGGNDVLQYKNILTNNTLTALEFLTNFADVLDKFKDRYKKMVTSLLKFDLPLRVCTIYNGNLEQDLVKPARVTVALFNDIIYQIAGEYNLPVIELRYICTESSDYANPIEPSSFGGRKIAQAINNIVKNIEF